MGYIKVIKSGLQVEYFRYERHAPIGRKVGKKGRRGKYRKNVARRRDNAKRVGKTVRRIIAANLVGTAPPALLTLTLYRNVAPKVAFSYLREFFERVRRDWSECRRYIAVVEYQRTGRLHFHVLVWGLPYVGQCTTKRGQPHSLCRNVETCERTARTLQRRWQRGFCDCRVTDGHPKLASYLTKYLFKAMLDKRYGGERAYSVSRACLRPLSFRDTEALAVMAEDVGVDNPALQEREYDTQWLGRCVYKTFKVN